MMTRKQICDLAATGAPVAVTCRVHGCAKQGFYKWSANPVPDRDEAHLIYAAHDVHTDDPELDHRFIADELQASGHQASERRVWRLSSPQELFSHTIRRAWKRGTRPGPSVCEDLVERDFTAAPLFWWRHPHPCNVTPVEVVDSAGTGQSY